MVDSTLELASDSLSVKLMFDYIEKDEGMVVQLTHTGSSSHDVNLSGTIIGSKEIINKSSQSHGVFSNVISSATFFKYSSSLQKDMPAKYSRVIGPSVFLISGIAYISVPILTWLSVIDASLLMIEDKTSLAVFFVTGIVFMIFGIHSLKRMIPKDFQSFYDDI